MQLTSTSIGRKILMAISGQCMVLFVVVHLLGNSSIFTGPGGINAYAEHLHSLPGAVLMALRLGMLTFVSVHIWFGIQLTIENRAANTQQYAVKAMQKTTFASENMIWTGLLIMAFIVYHLLHFTMRVTPGVAVGVDSLGRFDVFSMVVNGFKNFFIAFIYAGAMVTLFLHLSHGIQSFFQTMGWSTDKTQPFITRAGTLAALALFLGYVAIPLTIFAGILKG